MHPDQLVPVIETAHRFFRTTVACFAAEDAAFAPKPDMFTVAQQIAHTAQTVDWFVAGAFARADGFDCNFPAHEAQVRQVTSLAEALAWCDRSFAAAAAAVRANAERLATPLPPGIMGGMPRGCIAGALNDHTAHHRGSLSVYARLLGKVPPMPYA
jgi:uncharacterized damage-inducible protein DinB